MSNTSVGSRDETHKTVEWLTEAQIAGPSYLNDATHASIAVKHLESREHEIPLMARQGISQCKYSNEIAKLIGFTNNSTDVTVNADVESDDYLRLRDAMNNSGRRRFLVGFLWGLRTILRTERGPLLVYHV